MAERLTQQSRDYPRWYTEVVQRGDLADYAPVKGCMIIKPYGYALWENMQQQLDSMFKATGHVNAYFPLLIPQDFMRREAEHVEGFSPELAVVTHAGGKELEEPYVIRPTSETIIWHTFGKWISSYRDLPLLINQWANVVRWEMRTRLFLRTTEFLWQEGHTAHATAEEAQEETLRMLDIYREFAEDYMAVPVICGLKSEREKFAGAVSTYCIEALMGDKKALQAGTSHNLGQNFARAFDVTYNNAEGGRDFVWATSWGVSTRLIGALVMAHGDDAGLILPPRLAPVQAVVVPIFRGEEERGPVLEAANKLVDGLVAGGVRAKLDDRDQMRPGFKFAEWELKGVPLRLEVGPKDVANGETRMANRATGEKQQIKVDELLSTAPVLLEQIQKDVFQRALDFRNANIHRVDSYDEFRDCLDKEGGFILAHWDGSGETEEKIQKETKATIRCIPLEPLSPEDAQPGSCMVTGKPSQQRVIFARAY
ncbi:proline--tRNA ligase [bacterium]|nr:MAG: proline--tRNA ligase [bacterium]